MGCCCTDTRVRGAIAKANTNRLKTASPGQRNAALTTGLLKPPQVEGRRSRCLPLRNAWYWLLSQYSGGEVATACAVSERNNMSH